MVGRATSRTLIGRTLEQARLDAAFATARTGSPVTVLVTGEAGIGKTRLVRDLLCRAEPDSLVLTGGCVDEHIPYLPIADCLRSLQRTRWHADDGAEAELGLLSEWTSGTRRGADDNDSAGQLQRAFLRLLESLGRDGPVVLAIEDLHWSDVSTRNLLTYVIRVARDIPLLVIGTYRTDELTRRHPVRPFLAEITRLPLTEAIELGGLDPAAVAEMLADIIGEAPSPETTLEVHARCGGNPFLAEEVAASVLNQSGSRIPQRLQDILLARTSSLSAKAADVLRAASVGGVRVDDRLLRTVCSMSPRDIDSALRELLDRHLLAPDVDGDGYVFRHALTAEAVYEDSLPGERSRLHALFAQALHDDPDLAYAGSALAALERAGHWHRARHSLEALPAWVEAAAAAERVHAHPEALAAYESALELWPSIERAEALTGFREIELLRRAAEAAYYSGEPSRALSLAEQAFALVDERDEPLLAAVLLERLGRYAWLAGREPEALTHYERAVRLAPEHPPTAERAQALAGRAHVQSLSWLDASAAEGARSAIEVAREVGAPAVEAHALITLAVAAAHLGDEDTALAALAQAAELTQATLDDENAWRLGVNAPYVLFGLGRLDEAAREFPVWREVGLERSAGPHAVANQAWALVDLGRWDDARRVLDDELAYARSDWWPVVPLQVRAWLNWQTGDIEGAERDQGSIRKLAPALEQVQYMIPFVQSLAAVAIDKQQWEEAVQVVADAVRALPEDEGEPVVHWGTLTVAWLGLWAAGELVRERATASPRLTSNLAALDRVLAASEARAPDRQPTRHRALVALCSAERGRVQGTVSSDGWREAVDANDALGVVVTRAYTRVRLAEALLSDGGDRMEATAELNEAVSLFALAPGSPIRALAEGVARRARLRLTNQDAAKPQSAATGFGLTEREREVLGLLAEARTNREIGEALFMSPKTASVHVSSLMRKLGVNRRADAARLAKQVLVEETPPNS